MRTREVQGFVFLTSSVLSFFTTLIHVKMIGMRNLIAIQALEC